MNSSVKELQADANNPSVGCSALLRKAKIIASRLDQKDFIAWINKELDGYSKEDIVPDYRVVKGIPQAFNPYRGWVPYIHTDPKSHEIISQRGVGQSISQLEEVLNSNKGSLIMKYPPDIEQKLRDGIRFDLDIHLAIDRSEVVGIIDHVRNAILDWSIELEKTGILGESSEFSKKEITESKDIKNKYQIQHIENFSGNLGDANEYKSGSGVIIPKETFWNKFLWYVVVALAVVIVGNVASAFIIKYLGIN